MNKRLNEILAPARAIVRPTIPTHADIPVFPPDAKSIRTYYLWSNGRTNQRRPRPGGCYYVIDSTRAETTKVARQAFCILHPRMTVF